MSARKPVIQFTPIGQEPPKAVFTLLDEEEEKILDVMVQHDDCVQFVEAFEAPEADVMILLPRGKQGFPEAEITSATRSTRSFLN